MNNLIPNSELALTTALNLVRVGSSIPFTAYNSNNPGHGIVSISCSSSGSGHAGGITPGKLFFVEGNGTPHAALSAVSLTASASPAGNACTRVTGATNQFTGIVTGNTFHITGGTTTAYHGDYVVRAIDTVNHSYIDLFGGTSGDIIPHGTFTFSGNFYAGSAGVDTTVNGNPTQNLIAFLAAQGWPLKAVDCGTGTVVATLKGSVDRALNTSAGVLWEVANGDDGYGTYVAADGFNKSFSLKYYKTFKYDWDGVTAVTLPGSDYGCKVTKGSASEEIMWFDFGVANPFHVQTGSAIDTPPRYVNDPVLARMRGKNLVFGINFKSAAGMTVKPFIDDGITRTYGSAFTTTMGWQEVTATVSASATQCIAGVSFVGAIGDTAYGTQVMASYGTSIGAGNWEPYKGVITPFIQQGFAGYECADVNANTVIRIEQESLGQYPAGMQGIDLYLEGYSRNPATNLQSMSITDSVTSQIPGPPIHQQADNWEHHFSTGVTTIPDGTITFMGNGFVTTTESIVQFPITAPCRAVGLFAHDDGGVGGTTYYTIRKNGVDAAMQVVQNVSTPGWPKVSDTAQSHYVDFDLGDLFSVRLQTAGGVTPAHHHKATVRFITDPLKTGVIQADAGYSSVGRLIEASPAPAGTVTDILLLAGLDMGATAYSGWGNVNMATYRFWV